MLVPIEQLMNWTNASHHTSMHIIHHYAIIFGQEKCIIESFPDISLFTLQDDSSLAFSLPDGNASSLLENHGSLLLENEQSPLKENYENVIIMTSKE